MRGNEPCAGIEHDVALMGLGTGLHDVFAGLRRVLFGATVSETNALGVHVIVNVLEHHDVVGAGGDGCSGHDLDRSAMRKFDRVMLDRVAGADLSGDSKRLAR